MHNSINDQKFSLMQKNISSSLHKIKPTQQYSPTHLFLTVAAMRSSKRRTNTDTKPNDQQIIKLDMFSWAGIIKFGTKYYKLK